MHVLEHAPVAFLCSFLQHDIRVFFLTLTHRDVGERTSFNRLLVCETNLLDVRSRVNTREQNEEYCSLRVCLLIKIKYVERGLLNELRAQAIGDILNKSTA